MERIVAAMQAFVASLTAALLFIHTVLGCCWHHAHGSAPSVSQAAHCCHHHQHDDDSKPSQTPAKCKVDCEGACTYIVPQKVQIKAPQWVAMDLPAVLPSMADCQVEAAPSSEALLSLSDWVLPLRTHLLHQVLLN
jgi:hypothetical protein